MFMSQEALDTPLDFLLIFLLNIAGWNKTWNQEKEMIIQKEKNKLILE